MPYEKEYVSIDVWQHSQRLSAVHTFQHYFELLAFPADIGRKPASPARGSRQRLHAGHAYTPANEAADGTTWRRP